MDMINACDPYGAASFEMISEIKLFYKQDSSSKSMLLNVDQISSLRIEGSYLIAKLKIQDGIHDLVGIITDTINTDWSAAISCGSFHGEYITFIDYLLEIEIDFEFPGFIIIKWEFLPQELKLSFDTKINKTEYFEHIE